MSLQRGSVVLVDFAGATGVKRRPAVVLSGPAYHVERPDVILAVVTSNVAAATTSLDYVLKDWQVAGLRQPSAFRVYLGMAQQSEVRVVGKVSERDWQEIEGRVRRAMT